MAVELPPLLERAVARGAITAQQRDFLLEFARDEEPADEGNARTVIDSTRPARSEPDRARPSGSRYEVGKVLGRGGMGEVREARDPRLGRSVAVKTLRDPGNAGLLARFIEEAKVTGGLEHPNIVPVHELELDPSRGGPYLAMRLVRGKTLREILDRARDEKTAPEVTLGRLLDIFLKIADGVAYAHGQGVLHRDLKPENVMTGPFGEALVMDWGLAKVRGQTTGDKGQPDRNCSPASDPCHLTAAGAVMGTPAYMAPEQARGEIEKIDARSDVYALGAILYEILSLARPIDAESSEIAIAKAGRGEIEPPSARSRAPWSVPRELEAVVMKAMSLAPAKRYQSVRALAREIESFRAGRALRAAEYSPWQLLAKWARRNRIAVAGALATTIALVAGVAAVVWVLARAEVEKIEERERTRVAEQARRAESAILVYRDGVGRKDQADELLFNPASPESYFRAHVGALSAMGEALANHPDPHRDMREAVASYAEEIQIQAQRVGQWALAQILAESPHGWRAIDSDEKNRRLQGVDDAFREALAEDTRRLDELLRRIEPGENDGKKHGKMLDGELEERARRLATATRPEFARVALATLVGEPPARAPRSSAGRISLLEILGRRADPHTMVAGRTFPDLVREALLGAAEHPDPRTADETSAWILAGARLVSRSTGTLAQFPTLLERVEAAHPDRGPVADAARRARGILATQTPANAPPELVRALIEEAAEKAAVKRRSGSAFLRDLLERANGALADGRFRELATLLLVLGLIADPLPPDPESPRIAAIPIARLAFDRAWEVRGLPGAPSERRSACQEAAVEACVALSRLGDLQVSTQVYRRRDESGEYSPFWNRTRVAFALLPLQSFEAPETAGQFNARGIAREFQGDLEGAIADYDRAIELDPGHAKAYGNRGIARENQGDLAAAVADYTRAIELDPRSPVSYTNRGRVRRLQGDLAAASTDLTRAIELDPNYPLAHVSLGHVRKDQGDSAGAAGDFTRAIELDPDCVWAYIGRGGARTELRDLAGAVADYSRAIELDPQSSLAYNGRGAARKADGDLEGAVADYTRAIELDPDDAGACSNRGVARELQGDLAGALADHDRALELEPDSAINHNNRGMARKAQGDFAAAAADFTRAIEIDPNYALAYGNRGSARHGLGELAGAVADFTRAIELRPLHAWAYETRGVARLTGGDASGSIQDLERSLSLGPSQQGYLHLLLWIARTRAGMREDADRRLRAVLADLDSQDDTGWVREIAETLVGDAAEGDLLARIESEKDARRRAGLVCEAHFYAGMKHLLAGDRISARERLARCVETRRFDFIEWAAAKTELAAMDSGR